jgi:hypothetical protein
MAGNCFLRHASTRTRSTLAGMLQNSSRWVPSQNARALTSANKNTGFVCQRYEIYTDPYRKMPRLDLFGFDGAPMNPMYLAHNPPKMHPTITMNPLPTATGAKSTGSTKAKRSSVEAGVPFNRNAIRQREEPIDADKWWWIGAGMTALGSIGYFCS